MQPYTKVTSMHYQTLSKKDTTWKIDVTNLSVPSGQGRAYCYYSLTKVMILPTRMKNFTIPASRKFWWQSVLCLINPLGLDYTQGKFIQSLKNISIKKILMWHRKTFWRQNLHYGLIHVQALITHSMAIAGQWKKVLYCFSSKKPLKPVVVILCVTSLALEMQ